VNLSDFKQTLQQENPPVGLKPLLLALWHDAKGHWEQSHNIVSEIETKDAALIHAYLHRKEGDIWNADYWYRRAGTTIKDLSLEDEWNELAEYIIASRI